MIKLLALDLDGTLALPNNELLPQTKTSLEKMHDEGKVRIIIATGRRYRTSRNLIDNLEFEPYVVCNGGSLIKTPQRETFYSHSYNVSSVARIAREMKLTVFAQRDSDTLKGPDFLIDDFESWSQVTRKHHQQNKTVSQKADLVSGSEKILVAGVLGSRKDLERFSLGIEEKHPGQYSLICVPAFEKPNYYCEVSPAGVNKWTGIKKLLDYFRIEEKEVCAAGDQLNDMAMVNGCGHGFAMGNADPALKKVADFVCGDNDKNGLVEVMAYITRINSGANQING